MENKRILIAGNSNLELAEGIAKELKAKLCEAKISQFSDGECSVQINESVRGADVYVIQSMSTPVNDNLMELLVMNDALKRASANRITAVVPYFGYARQDRKARARDPITAKLVADILTKSGASRLLTMDLHAPQLQGFFDIPVDSLLGIPVLAKAMEKMDFIKDDKNLMVVSPDVGSVARARQMAEMLNVPFAIVDKRRPKANEVEIMHIVGNVEGKTCLLVDDMIDTAGTICNGAKALLEVGKAKKVYVCCTHAVLSGPAVERLQNSVIEKVFTLNTISVPKDKKFSKLIEVSVAPIFAKAIQAINTGSPVSKLYE
ncbi:MAG: ribose-phosphate pyrophosphokinase [Firmicutes bacterium]|nr:ribose-phosphate pyrophosphokinase [Bacillota bacterium]MCL2256527.1 ribose-phosphate pyrophosphokinase [Bacillota bacterium]